MSESFRAREESLLRIAAVMAGYHRKCGEDGWRPSTFMLWLNAEPGGEVLPHVTPSGIALLFLILQNNNILQSYACNALISMVF
jgi:hypothetical protein